MCGRDPETVKTTFTKDDSVIGMSPNPHRRSGSLASLDYLGLDPGHEADIDSVASSRYSSRIFFDKSAKFPFPRIARPQSLQSSTRSGLNYDSEYDNYRPGMVGE